MDEYIFKVLTNNQVYFCEKDNDISTSSVYRMIECFDVFILDDDVLFYRLRSNCSDLGFKDENECLVVPCEGYNKMICISKILKDDNLEPVLKSFSWMEEEDFYHHKNSNTLKSTVEEIYELYQEATQSDENQDNNLVNNDNLVDNDNNLVDNLISNRDKDNFKHGYSSSNSE